MNTTTINLRKGDPPISMTKTAVITAYASWPAATDYDLYALVLNRDGTVVHVAQFGAKGVPPLAQYKGIRQDGDARRGAGISTETLTIALDDSIAAVVPVAYSAQSNGSGSFHRYKVSLAVDNGAGHRIEMDASNASRNNGVYTCVPAIIHNGTDGKVWIDPVELYSRGGERRPAVHLHNDIAVVTMDAGPQNDYK